MACSTSDVVLLPLPTHSSSLLLSLSSSIHTILHTLDPIHSDVDTGYTER